MATVTKSQDRLKSKFAGNVPLTPSNVPTKNIYVPHIHVGPNYPGWMLPTFVSTHVSHMVTKRAPNTYIQTENFTPLNTQPVKTSLP